MTLDKFFEIITQRIFRTSYIVRLAYKYDFEKAYTYDNEFLEWDYERDEWVWLNDWDEGQDDVFVVDFVALCDVFISNEEVEQ